MELKDISQANCFVHGLALEGDGSGSSLEAPGAFKKPVWLHLDYSEDDCESVLRTLGVPPNAIDALVRINTRPRTILEGAGLVIFLRAINLNPGSDPDDMVSLRMWIEHDRLITIRQRKVYSIQDIRQELVDGKGPASIQRLIIRVIERLADRISEYVDELENKIDDFEELGDAGNPSHIRSSVSALRRHAAVVRRYLAPQREALDSFNRQYRDALDDQHVFDLHEQSDRIIRYVEDLDLIKERCLVLQEELMNRIAQEQNNRMYVLSIVAAIFLPISFVTGLFGMNVAGLPGVENPVAFDVVALIMAAIVGGILVWFKIKRWL